MALSSCPIPEQDQLPDGFVPAGYAQLPDEPNAGSFDGVIDAGTLEPPQQPPSVTAVNSGNVVSMNGIGTHIYGDLGRLGFSSTTCQGDVTILDTDEEEEEEMRSIQAEVAIREAIEADEVRRSAQLPPEQCGAIKDAMRGISLGNFRPDWADQIPEEEWMKELKRKMVRKPGLCAKRFFS